MAETTGHVVVIAVDKSPQAEAAFDFYSQHLHRPENVVIVAYVQSSPTPTSNVGVGQYLTHEQWQSQVEAEKGADKTVRDKYTGKMEANGIRGEFVARYGKPGETICDLAKQQKARHIVMGTRGLGSVRRTILGSVSDFVVHHAHCPVTIHRS